MGIITTNPRLEFGVSTSDIQDHPWQHELTKASRKQCDAYRDVFAAAAEAANEAGNNLGNRVYRLLAAVASFLLSNARSDSPYAPMHMERDGRRSLIPDDLADGDLAALDGIVRTIDDHEFRARVADVLWIRRKDPAAARLAVSSFLRSASDLEGDSFWLPFVERLSRAGTISAPRGFEPERQSVIQEIRRNLDRLRGDETHGFCCLRLVGILESMNAIDPIGDTTTASHLAIRFDHLGKPSLSVEYWNLAARLHATAGNHQAARDARISAAEALFTRGGFFLKSDPPEHWGAAHWFALSLEAMRQANGEPARIAEIHGELIEQQRLATATPTSLEFSTSQIPGYSEGRAFSHQRVASTISGTDFRTAVQKFANFMTPNCTGRQSDPASLRESFSPWPFLIQQSRVNRDGKTVGTIPGSLVDQEQKADQSLLHQLAAHVYWPMAVDWIIEPARAIIMAEHQVTHHNLEFLVRESRFIRPDHEALYLQGVHAGFQGNWVVAMHLLIPQIEESVRHLFRKSGKVTSTLKQGVQEEKDLNVLLRDPSATDILGTDLLFDLKGLLIERFGANLRNEVAHGLRGNSEFNRPDCIYLWWLVVHILHRSHSNGP